MLALFLRLWSLGNVPPSASMDEASIGYNAYSVLKTGVDEFGEFPLISQRGYDDWRRSTYLFLVIPSVSLFGLNAFAIKLPAVILSIITIYATYKMVLLMFPKRSSFSLAIALLVALSLAISPWHIYISRLGHESNAYLSFLVFGVLALLLGEKRKNWKLILLSSIFFILSMISYYPGQVFIPLFVAGSFFIFRKNITSIILSNKKIIIPFFVLGALTIPIFINIFSPKALIRFQGTGIFMSQPDRSFEYAIKRAEAIEQGDFFKIIIYNRRVLMVRQFSEGYIVHLNPKWLFTNSHAEPFKASNMGLLYFVEIPFVLIGIIVFLFSRAVDPKIRKLFILWFLLAPFPAALATQAPHAMRSYTFLPMWQIFSAFGIWYAFFNWKKFYFPRLVVFIALVTFNLATFYKNYFFIFPREQSPSFHYALSKTIPYVLSNQDKYNKIIFSNRDNLYQSYMLFLFYSKYDPLLYQKHGGTKSGGYAETHSIGKYEFRPIVWLSEKEKNTLYVGNITDFPSTIHARAKFSQLNGEDAIKVVEGK